MDPTLPLPEHGFVVTYMDIPVCVVGLRPCDGTTGMIDGLTTNPEISAFIRNKALEVFAVEIELLAKSMGLKAVLAVSEDSHTLQRALKHGYKLSQWRDYKRPHSYLLLMVHLPSISPLTATPALHLFTQVI
jgi:hypothetical protein